MLLLPTQSVYGGPQESSYIWLQVRGTVEGEEGGGAAGRKGRRGGGREYEGEAFSVAYLLLWSGRMVVSCLMAGLASL